MKFRATLKPRALAGMFNGFNPDRFDTLIGKLTRIHGVVYANTIRVDGVCDGDMVPLRQDKKPHAVIVGAGGIINGDILDADFVIVAGYVRGHVVAKKQLIVKTGGSIIGDVEYTDIALESGGTIHGHMKKYEDPSVVDEPVVDQLASGYPAGTVFTKTEEVAA